MIRRVVQRSGMPTNVEIAEARPSRLAELYRTLSDCMIPAVENSQYVYARVLQSLLTGTTTRWLDLGCGHDVFPDWFPEPLRRLRLGTLTAVGIDEDEGALQRHSVFRMRVRGDIERLPFRSQTFDLITANMVLEHVERPGVLFDEIGRVLTPGGRLIVHTPNAWGYTTLLTRAVPKRFRRTLASWLQRRAPEDVYPTHYRANSKAALSKYIAAAALEVREITYLHSSPQLFLVPALGIVEVVLIRLLSKGALAPFRACLIGVFQKPQDASFARSIP